MRYLFYFCLVVVCNSLSAKAFTEEDVEPSIEMGAYVYSERCVDCHGLKATGDGVIPLKIKGYPSANLKQPLQKATKAAIRKAVIYGGSQGNMSNFMPPMGNDLTWSETEAVVNFLMLLKDDYNSAIAMVTTVSAVVKPSQTEGRDLFLSHCILCHGKYGDGKGRMAKIIKTPPPANLVYSRLPDDYLRKIISGGGESMSRSPQMPPWKDEFSPTQIDSIILYIKSIRN